MPGAFEATYTAGNEKFRSGPPSADAAGALPRVSSLWRRALGGQRLRACAVLLLHRNWRGRATLPRDRRWPQRPRPQWDTRWRGGPDCDVGHFQIGCTVVCARPAFTGFVTAFNGLIGEHTESLADGATRICFLSTSLTSAP